jgi:hypothetical protein
MTEKVPLSKQCSVAPHEWRRTCSSDGEVTASWLAETAEVSAAEAGYRSRAAAPNVILNGPNNADLAPPSNVQSRRK